MTFSQIGMLASVFAAMCIAGRIAFIYLFLEPVLGRVLAQDYDRDERRMERFSMMVTPGETSWGDPTDVIPVRSVCTRVAYSYGGADYRNDVTVTVVKGWSPGGLVQLWIDAKNPNDVTARGPGYWCCWLLFAGLSAMGCRYVPF